MAATSDQILDRFRRAQTEDIADKTSRTRSDDYSVSVYAVIRRRGRILLTQDHYNPGWKLPGGGVEPDELILEALKREVREEVGLEIRPRGLLLMANWLKKRTSLGRLRLYLIADSVRGAIALGTIRRAFLSGEIPVERLFRSVRFDVDQVKEAMGRNGETYIETGPKHGEGEHRAQGGDSRRRALPDSPRSVKRGRNLQGAPRRKV